MIIKWYFEQRVLIPVESAFRSLFEQVQLMVGENATLWPCHVSVTDEE